MSENPQELSHIVAQAERIGVIGSPSATTDISLDIMASAVNRKLVGELALFHYLQDGLPHYALGQITEVRLRNVWHEDPTMRSLIRNRGRIDAVSERQDTHLGEMTISAVFSSVSQNYRPSILGTVPPTGTPICLVEDEILNRLLAPYQDQLFYLGRVYGSTPRLPLWFKHFDTGPEGAGEAYHIGVFGKTGSGKSVLAKMILLAYSRHSNMGLFVLDPMGEFSRTLRERQSDISMGNVLNQQVLQGLNRPVEVFDLSRMRLVRWNIFELLLAEFGFFRMLGFRNREYQEEIAEYVRNALEASGAINLGNLTHLEAYNEALNSIRINVDRVYATQRGQDRVLGFVDIASESGPQEGVETWDTWLAVTRFFAQGPNVEDAGQIARRALATNIQVRPMVIVDLSRVPEGISRATWDERIKPLLIDYFLDELIRRAELAYDEEESLNTLVVIDEAHRLAPAGRIENEQRARIRTRLVDSVRTTRKFGLGWMFLSQTFSSLDKEIRQQIRISFFGFGLGFGTELDTLRELIGGDRNSLSLYQRFRDPQSAFDQESKEYSFMTIGPVSPLSFAGTPLFFNAFNNIDMFLDANNLTRGN